MIPGSSRTSSKLQHTQITPVHERISRRILGLPVEYGPRPHRTVKMTGRDNSAPVPPTTSTHAGYLVQQQRVPKPFYGEAFEGAEDWLDQFQRVARLNDWDQKRKFQNLCYVLEQSSRTWLENREAEMS